MMNINNYLQGFNKTTKNYKISRYGDEMKMYGKICLMMKENVMNE